MRFASAISRPTVVTDKITAIILKLTSASKDFGPLDRNERGEL